MENKEKGKNKMAEIEIEKVILSGGAVAGDLEKSAKLIEVLTGEKPVKTKAKKRIPAFNIRPGLEIGCKVTLRKNYVDLLKRLLEGVGNVLKRKQISENSFSFGIEEYITVPGMEYQRDIGMIGLNVTVSFKRKGKRVKIKKIKRGKLPRKQNVSQEEIINFMKTKFNMEIEEQNDSK